MSGTRGVGILRKLKTSSTHAARSGWFRWWKETYTEIGQVIFDGVLKTVAAGDWKHSWRVPIGVNLRAECTRAFDSGCPRQKAGCRRAVCGGIAAGLIF